MSLNAEVISGLSEVSDKFQGFLFDVMGVLKPGEDAEFFPQAKEAMEKLAKSGKAVGLLTNATQLEAEKRRQFHKLGLEKDKHYHFLVTSGEATRQLLLQDKLPFAAPRRTYSLFCEHPAKFPPIPSIFDGTTYQKVQELQAADFIFISVPHIDGVNQQNPDAFREKIKGVLPYKIPMVCPNPDEFAFEGKPPMPIVRQGTIARLYEEMGGVVFRVGKPHEIVYQAAMSQFRARGIFDTQKMLMVGDTPETDIRGARAVKMPSLLLTKTGIMAERIQKMGFEAAFGKLEERDLPDYLMDELKV